jgi:MFS transporter, Spinster family, sphingosine-1-phosphate transporter
VKLNAPAEPGAAALPAARPALILLLAINLFNYLDRQVLAAVVENIEKDLPMPAVPEWLQRLFGSDPTKTLVGLLAMAFMATYMLTAPVFGWMAGRVSRWWLVGIGVAVWSLASGASGRAKTFGLLFLTRCFVGIGEGAYGPIAPDMISDLYPVKVRGSVLAWFYMAIPVGSALGYVLGGMIGGSSLGWRWAFYLVVPPGLLLALACLFMKEPARGLADLGERSAPHKARWSDYVIFFKTPSYVLNTLGMTAMTFAIGGLGFWMPYYIRIYRGYGEQGFVATTFGVIVVVAGLSATLLGGYAGDRLRTRFPGSYFLVSGLAMLVGFPLSVAMLFVPFPWAWVFVFLACFCLFFNTGPTNTILANVTHPAMRASGFALNILVIHALGDVISPLVIGAITDASGNNMNLAFLMVSAMFVVGGSLWLWGARYLERDTKMAPMRLGP